MKKSLVILLPFFLLISCSKPENTKTQDKLIQAVLWYQHSAEMKALYYQGYNIAISEINAYKSDSEELPPAVVLDIDETVLDNSAQSGRQVLDNVPYSEELWDQWCKLEEAVPLPGALEFTSHAKELGIEVFYITNRKEHLKDVTIANLEKFGFPYADEEHVLPRIEGSSSSKNERRAAVAGNYRILLLLGDNLGDFDGMFDDRSVKEGCDAVENARDEFGTRFIIFPNPIYGAWERAALAMPDGTKMEPIDAIRGFRTQKE